MTNWTPWSALAGGVLIGLAAVLLMAALGRIAGISGIAGEVLRARAGRGGWRALFLAGLVLGAALTAALTGSTPAPRPGFPAWALVLGGLLVGYGSTLGNGCTSGHGVCGLARLSWRSLAATLTFLATGLLATWVARHALGLA